MPPIPLRFDITDINALLNYPVNWKALIPAVLGTISICLTLHSTLSCRYVTLSGPSGFTQNRGIWYLEGFERIGDSDEFKNVCTAYPPVLSPDSIWKSTKVFTFFGSIVGTGAASFLWSCMMNPLSKENWRLLAVACVLSCLFTSFSSIFLVSNACRKSDWVMKSPILRNCNFARGFNTSTAATVFWLVTAVIMLQFPPYVKSEQKEKVDEENVACVQDNMTATVASTNVATTDASLDTGKTTELIPNKPDGDLSVPSEVVKSVGKLSEKENTNSSSGGNENGDKCAGDDCVDEEKEKTNLKEADDDANSEDPEADEKNAEIVAQKDLPEIV